MEHNVSVVCVISNVWGEVVIFVCGEWVRSSLRWLHDDVIKWKDFRRYWTFVSGIHRWSVNSLHKGRWHGALMFGLIRAWINGWVNNREAGDLRRRSAYYDVTVMSMVCWWQWPFMLWFFSDQQLGILNCALFDGACSWNAASFLTKYKKVDI